MFLLFVVLLDFVRPLGGRNDELSKLPVRFWTRVPYRNVSYFLRY